MAACSHRLPHNEFIIYLFDQHSKVAESDSSSDGSDIWNMAMLRRYDLLILMLYLVGQWLMLKSFSSGSIGIDVGHKGKFSDCLQEMLN